MFGWSRAASVSRSAWNRRTIASESDPGRMTFKAARRLERGVGSLGAVDDPHPARADHRFDPPGAHGGADKVRVAADGRSQPAEVGGRLLQKPRGLVVPRQQRAHFIQQPVGPAAGGRQEPSPCATRDIQRLGENAFRVGPRRGFAHEAAKAALA